MQREVHRIAQQAPGAADDDRRDDQAHQQDRARSSRCRASPAPASTTPRETAASAAMCRNAPFTFRSCSRPRRNSSAVSRVDHDAAQRHPDDRHGGDRRPGSSRRCTASTRDAADHQHQQHGIDQRGEDGGTAQAIGKAPGGHGAGRECWRPRRAPAPEHRSGYGRRRPAAPSNAPARRTPIRSRRSRG